MTGHVVTSPRPELETGRLRLRQFREDDLDAYARITADPETTRYIGDGRPFDRDEAWRSLSYLLGHWEMRGFGLWAAEEKTSGALVGRIGLYRPEGWPGLEVGWLVDRRREGEGFATEGGEAALRWAFETLAPPRVISLIQPANAASIRVAEKLGERCEREIELSGKRVLLYAIDAATWAAR
ncbi:MAG: GNAT family N-acetyltransferase [Myxococcota bacterium]